MLCKLIIHSKHLNDFIGKYQQKHDSYNICYHHVVDLYPYEQKMHSPQKLVHINKSSFISN